MIVRIVTLLLAALALTACTAPTSGIPAGESTAISQPPSARPRELRLDQLDPCTVLSSEQRLELGVGKGHPGTASFIFEDHTFPACQWSRFPQEPQDMYLIGPDVARGVIYPPLNQAGIRVIEISGFAAVEFEDGFAEHDRNCVLKIDVAAGQTLFVRYDYDGATVPMTRKLACEKARTVAEVAIQTLTERGGG